MKLAPQRVKIESDESGKYFLICEEGKKSIRVDVDFTERNKIGLRSDLLARAIGYKANNPKNTPALTVVDATAGLCRDAFHMASLGCQVLALEENEKLFEVMHDHVEKLSPKYNLKIKFAEATKYMAEQLENKNSSHPQVVYLDPMFPEKKKSAKSGKESILLKLLAAISAPENEIKLFDLALQFASQRVVVKRPLFAPPLKSNNKKYAKPQIQFEGKAVRFDVYVVALSKPS